MLRQTISQKMLQKLSPQQIQLMKLLQIPTVNLEQRIKEELEANPALEEGGQEIDELFGNQDDGYEENENANDANFELDEYIQEYIDDDPASYKLRSEGYSGEEEDKQRPVAVENSLHDYLEQQIGLLELEGEKEEAIARQIIGSIDDDGYLRRDPYAIVDDLMFSGNIIATEAEVLRLLRKIQKFEPPGIAARDLQECLRIQIDIKIELAEENNDPHLDSLLLARHIIRDFFEEFTKKHYDKMQRQLNLSEDDLKEAIDEILKLNPKPASGYASNPSASAQYITPDFIILNNEGELELTLNSRNAPDLRISDQYRDMLKSYRDSTRTRDGANRQQKEAAMFIKQKIDSAKWFIDAIRQRQHTLYSTMYAIMQYQYNYFLSGEERRLRPMILQDIADLTGLDISTISRVVNSKYVQTEFGVRRLKDFFSESLSTSDGEEVSTLEVKNVLKEIIDGENKRKPLSDEKLKDLLLEKGYDIARRTVAKYREQLNIPVARLRKAL
jgi:RNA polymerase sigma-54 factor